MNILNLKNIFCFLFFFIIIFSEFFLFSNLFSTAPLFADDINSVLEKGKLYNGLVIPSVLDNIFITYIPEFFKIHPQDFKMDFFKFIESLIVLIFIFILNQLIYPIKKFDHKFILYFIFNSSLFFTIITQQPYVLFLYEGFFRMVLPIFLFILLFINLLKNEEYFSVKKYIITSLLTLCCCTSNEMICITTIVGLFLYVLTISRKNVSKSEIKFNLSLCLVALIGFLILIKTGAFFRKGSGDILNFSYLFDQLKNINEFLINYIRYIFIDHIIEYILLFTLTFILLRQNKENNYKKIILTYSFLIGIFIFFFFLIFLGKTHYTEGQYWIIHKDLHLIFDFLICAFILNFYYLLEKKYEFLIITLFLIGTIFMNKINYEVYFIRLKSHMNKLKIEMYKAEKILRLAAIKEKTAYLDESYFKETVHWILFYSPTDIEKEKLYEESGYTVFLNDIENNYKFTKGYIYTNEKIVLKNFNKNGGTFTEEELEKTKFTNLMDKNFILRNKKEVK